MIIPISELSADTLRSIVESFVLREGTDYGEQEVDFKQKVDSVLNQIHAGEVVVQYSELHETVDLVPRQDIPSE